MSTEATLLATGMQGGEGSAVGPDGALYLTDNVAGQIWRVDTPSGELTLFADGLPPSIIGLGRMIDVAFIGETAYALLTLR